MIDTIRLKLTRFKVINTDNFFCGTNAQSLIPYIDTLKDNKCYWDIPSDGNYQEYHLKSYIKYQPLGYRPSRIVIKDIPIHIIRFWLEIEISLPKVIYGHNFCELQKDHFGIVINSLYEMLLQFGVQIDPEELATTTSISRIDFCKNVLIQSSAKDFIRLLQKVRKKRCVTYDRYETSVLFGNRQQGLIVYDKVEEITKVLRDKKYNNKASKEYEVAKIVDAYKKAHGLEIIRIEHRLLNRQTIKREIGLLIGRYPLSLKDVFDTRICSAILQKHWFRAIPEEKLKLLLLGEKNLNLIFDRIATASNQLSSPFNPLSVIYVKLISEIGEKEADKKILRIKSSSSLNNYKKALQSFAPQIFFMIPALKIIGKLLNPYKNFLPFLFLLFLFNYGK